MHKTRGVTIRHWARPIRILTDGHGNTSGVAFERTALDAQWPAFGRDGEIFDRSVADQVMKAIGQTFDPGRR